METIIIDPNKAYDQNAIYLKQLFVSFKDKVSVFEKNRLYKMPNEEDLWMAVSDTVIARERDSNKNELRYEVIDGSKLFGEGGYSQIYPIKCTLAIEGDTIITKRKKARLVKVQKHDEDELDDIFRENELTRRAGDLHMKLPVIRMLRSNSYISYSVMRKINGMDLFDFINDLSENKLHITTEDRLKLSIRLLEKLTALHEKKIIHRDIKPENIIIDPVTHDVTFIDYGLSKKSETPDSGERVGTLGYSPFECLSGKGTNEKTDLFEIAIVIGLLWQAEAPEATIAGTLSYQFPGLFAEGNIDLEKFEKTQITTILKRMTQDNRDERCSVAVALKKFKDILKSYQQRKTFDMFSDKAYKILSDRGFMENKSNKKTHSKKPVVERRTPRSST